MKPKFSILLVVLVFLFSNCNSNASLNPARSLFLSLFGLISGDPVRLSGKAMKGEIKNAVVRAVPISKDGICDRSESALTLAKTTSDSSGNYSLRYYRYGSPICIVVTPDPEGKSTMYDEKTKTDLAWVGEGIYLQSVVREPEPPKVDTANLSSSDKLNLSLPSANITPLTRIASRRLETLGRGNNDSSQLNDLAKKANQEVTLRFGLFNSSGISTETPTGIPGPSYQTKDGVSRMSKLSSKAEAPEISTREIDSTSNLILGGISVLSNDVKSGSNVSAEEVDNVVNAFSESMATGEFRSTNENGEAITLGFDGRERNLGDNPASGTLQSSTLKYVRLNPSLNESIVFYDSNEPGFRPTPSILKGRQQVEITAIDNTAKIYYTMNGSEPTCDSGTEYKTFIPIETLGETTIKAVACKNGVASKVKTGKYKIIRNIIANPVIEPVSGEFNNEVTISMNQSSGAKIYYTLDGSEPICGKSEEYKSSLTISNSAEVTAIACNGAVEESMVAYQKYTVIQPPFGLSYSASSSVYTRGGEVMPNFARVTGERLSFKVEPELPSGLKMNSSNGKIYGKPDSNSAMTKYVVTASNSAGSTSASIQIEVNDAPPAGLRYMQSVAIYTKNVLIYSNEPTVIGSGLTYSISPALPDGLTINSKTGVISGKPSTIVVPKKHTITAKNTGGEITYDLVIGVNDSPPSSLSYSNSNYTFSKDNAIPNLVPSYTGSVSVFGIDKQLPAGLRFDTQTGSISGTALVVMAAPQTYTVSASNVSGSTSFELSIMVEDNPPSGLTYQNSALVLTKGISLNPQKPTVSGTVASFSITPDLPAGLILDSATGELNGIPTVLSTATEYTVSASNKKGSSAFKLLITVEDNPPTGLSYSGSPFSLTKSVSLNSVKPSVTGTVTKYSVSPALPSGLNLDSVTGEFGGIPSEAVGMAIYTVTASNTKGSVSFPLTLSIEDASPKGLAYSESSIVYTKDTPIQALFPSLSGTAERFSISPTLPTGLSLNSTTGVISGTPRQLLGTTNFTITATNPFGSTSYGLQLTVNDLPPYSLKYPNSSYTLTKDVTLNPVVPSYGGTVLSFTVSPSLPSGLSLNSSTGSISGTPTALSGLQSYTITASNTVGSTTTTVSISVSGTPPTSLSYPSNSYAFSKGLPIVAVMPSVSGSVSGYSVSPSLPLGLSVNPVTGVLSGTPQALSNQQSYTLTATNSIGSATFAFSLQVVDAAPSGLAYSGSPYTLVQYTDIPHISASIVGTASSYSVSPALPQGISLNTTTGSISGIPQVASPLTTYTITASNASGSTSASIQISVGGASYPISGTISGLNGTGLQISNGSSTISIANGSTSFSFAPVATGTNYTISVVSQPTNVWQTCSVTAGASGMITVNPVSNVAISCTTNQYTVGGSLSGLAGTGLQISDGAGNTLTPSNGSFSFPARLSGSSYNVTINSSPTNPWQTCTVTGGSGTVGGSDVTSIAISCVTDQYAIGGSIYGLAGGGSIVLSNGIGTVNLNSNTAYNFAVQNSGTNYTVSITQQPAGQYCTIFSNSALSGTITNSHVTGVNVNCVNGYMVGGKIQTHPPAPIDFHLYQGNVTTLAGSGTSGSSDGTGAGASFNLPEGITFDGTNFYVADLLNHKIRQITTGGTVTTFAGNGSAGNTTGFGAISSLNQPRGIVTDGTFLYVSEYSGQRIKRIRISTGNVETIAGDNSSVTPSGGFADGIGTAAKFYTPTGLALDSTNLFIADRTNGKIRKLDLITLSVTTLSIGGNLTNPEGLVLVGNYLYTSDITNHSIVRIDKTTGAQTLFAGGSGSDFVDAIGTSAKFNQPTALTTDGNSLYVTDFGNYRIRRIEISSQKVTTLLGNGSSSLVNGVGVAASMYPMYITTNGKELYFTDTYTIRKITNNGLVAYYPLTNNPLDYLGTNNGTLNGSPAFTAADRFNNANSAITFNGSSQYINASDAGLPSGSLARSGCAWIKPNIVPNGNETIFSYGTASASQGYGIVLNGNGSKLLTVIHSNFGGDDLSIPFSIPAGIWTHICGVYTGSSDGNYSSIYVNGKLIGKKSISPPVTILSNLRIGNQLSNSEYFNGNIADVRIYSRALNDGEINELAQNASQALVGASYSTGATGLLTNFHLDSGSNNSSGAISNLNFTGTTAGNAIGKEGDTNGARVFDGAGNYLTTGALYGLPASSAPRTVCSWINLSDFPAGGNYYYIATYGTDAANQTFGLAIKNANPNIQLLIVTSAGAGSTFNIPISLNTWNHVCGSYDGTNANAYLNGSFLGSSAVSLNTQLTTFTIGSFLDASSKFKGKLDEIRIYNNALSATAIRQLAALVPSGLVARYDFNGDANDVSGFGLNAGLNTASLTMDRFNNANAAYLFNGTYITTGKLPLSTGATYSAWIKPTALPTSGLFKFIMGNDDGSNGASLYLYNNAGTQQIYYKSYNGGTTYFCSYNITLPLNVYSHVTITESAGKTLYVNGRSITAASCPAGNTNYTNNINFAIGNSFNGDIDDVHIYDRALSAAEVLALSGYHPMQVTNALTTMKMHYQADSLSNLADNANVTSWSDNSNSGNDVTQGTPANRPIYKATTFVNKPGVEFIAGKSLAVTSGTAPASTSTTFIAHKTLNPIDSANGNQILNYGDMQIWLTFSANNYRLRLGKTGVTGLVDSTVQFSTLYNVPVISAYTYDYNVAASYHHNGTANTNGTPTTNQTFTGTTLTLSGMSHIGDIVYYNAVLSTTDRELVECYLSSKYGVPLGHSCP